MLQQQALSQQQRIHKDASANGSSSGGGG